MNFFSGFSLQEEKGLFERFIKDSDYIVCGFSLGAIEAFEFSLDCDSRIDRLKLFSPAFFHQKGERFKRLQMISYKNDQASYEEQFLKNISYPSDIDMKRYFKRDRLESLDKLLNFVWEKDKLEILKDRGIDIEVYLGAHDKIIDSKKAYQFFKEFATVYFIKEGGHILHG